MSGAVSGATCRTRAAAFGYSHEGEPLSGAVSGAVSGATCGPATAGIRLLASRATPVVRRDPGAAGPADDLARMAA